MNQEQGRRWLQGIRGGVRIALLAALFALYLHQIGASDLTFD